MIFQDDFYNVSQGHLAGVNAELLANLTDPSPALQLIPEDHNYSTAVVVQTLQAHQDAGAEEGNNNDGLSLEGPRPEPIEVVPSPTDQETSPTGTVSASELEKPRNVIEEITEVIKVEKIEDDSMEKTQQVNKTSNSQSIWQRTRLSVIFR